MHALRTAGDRELTWTQPSALKREYTLHAGDERFAALRFEKAFGSLALAETATERWTFKRSGFWQPRVSARLAGADTDIALFEAGWSGAGTLTLIAGTRYRWGATNFWHSHWAWHDARGEPLVHYRHKTGFKTEGSVELHPDALDLPELALLVPLGWYLMVLLAEDMAVATGAVVATTGATTGAT